VQQACLRVITDYEADGDALPTTYNITADVYQVKPDQDGNRWVTDAQHAAVKRALEGLQRKARIIGFYPHTRDRCHVWMTEKRAQRFVKETMEEARCPYLLLGDVKYLKSLSAIAYTATFVESIEKKMRAVGMRTACSDELPLAHGAAVGRV
jgi:hypothetical protein